MSNVTQILSEISAGAAQPTETLLALLYDDLRRMAAGKLAHEGAGQSLQATELVHEAYMRLVGNHGSPSWENRAHFVGAASEAMRRILINRARDKKRLKRGGGAKRLSLNEIHAAQETPDEDLLALDEAIGYLQQHDSICAQLVKLRFFGGLSLAEAANCLNLAPRTADRYWSYARAWLADQLRQTNGPNGHENSRRDSRTIGAETQVQ